jgi:RNA polymerase sigma-70 factor, ECF subfamily
LSDGDRERLSLERSDRALIEESLSGSLRAFDELMVRHQKLVYKIALGYGWGREHALDISQNVFLKVYENLGSLRASDRFKTWLTRITYHESLNWIRKHRKHLNYEQVDDCIMVSSAGDQERELLGKESRTMLVKSLFHLSRKQRLVVILRYFNGMSIQEIAAVLKCSEGLVKNILFRSVRRLRENLGRHSAGNFNEPVHRIRTVS